MRAFIVGLLIGFFVLFPLAIYLCVRLGYLSLATNAKPFPGEEFLAGTALRASIGSAADQKNPLALNDENLMAGAKQFREHCAVCHGLPGQLKGEIASGMFPPPPQLFEKDNMVTDDPEGTTNWKIKNGIRLSGMPAFPQMSDEQRWDIVMLLKHADKLPTLVTADLSRPLH